MTRLPPYLVQAREERIEAIDLGGINDAALFDAAQGLYNSVVASDADGGIPQSGCDVGGLSDALYHNAYMRDDGVIATVADHIAATLSFHAQSGDAEVVLAFTLRAARKSSSAVE